MVKYNDIETNLTFCVELAGLVLNKVLVQFGVPSTCYKCRYLLEFRVTIFG